MKRKIKYVGIGMVFVVLLLLVSCFIYVHYFFRLDIFKAGPTAKVDLSGWEKLEKGMTRQEVIRLLGDSGSKAGPGNGTINGKEFRTTERWEYNYTVGLSLFGEVHDKAYVVYFDNNGVLSSWREPKDKESEDHCKQAHSVAKP